MTYGLTDRPLAPAGMHWQEQDGQVLLLHPNAARWAIVNATGLAVARLCDGRRTVAEIAAAVAAPYGLEPEVVLPDVAACLEGLDQAGFLGQAPAAVGPLPKQRTWRLHVYLTERCNLRCTHCGVEAGCRPPDHLPGDTVRRLIDEAIAADVDGVAFSGGEPLLRPDCLALLRYAHERSLAETGGRVKVLLSTNGTLIDEPTADALVEMGAIVQISLDGASAATHDAVRHMPGEAAEGAFARTWAGIRRLLRRGVGERLALNVTIMRHNVDETAAIVALAAAEGVPAVRFAPVQAMGRGADNWQALAPTAEAYEAAYDYLYHGAHPPGVVVSQGLPGQELEPPAGRSWCGLGRLLLVDSRGDIYPCSLLTEPEFRLGHVDDLSLVEALASPRLHDLAAMCDRRRDEIEACAACAWRHFCQGSCPGSIWLEHGTWHAVDGFCDLRRALFPALILGRATKRGPSCGDL